MDLLLHETGNGGDLSLNGNDVAVSDGFTNMPYIGWFGGNPLGSTTGNEIPNEQRLDWWGNSLLFPNNKNIQVNSALENALNTIPLNSEGRNLIEQAAKEDMKFFSNFAQTSVSVSILSDDKVQIDLKVNEPSNLQSKDFQYIWDATRQEIITQIEI